MLTRMTLAACMWAAFAVPCLIAAEDKPAPEIKVDKDKKTVVVPCVIAERKLPHLKEAYPIEVVATHPHPKGKKAHETVVNFDVKPSAVHKALEQLGLKPGKPIQGAGKPTGPEVEIYIILSGDKKISIDKALVTRAGKPVPAMKWYFTGSDFKEPDPEKDEKVYGADLMGTLISIFPVTNDTVFQSNLTLDDEKGMKLEVSKDLPKAGTPVMLLIQAK